MDVYWEFLGRLTWKRRRKTVAVSGRDSDSSANSASQSTRKSSSTLASIKSSFIEKVNHAASIRRQRSSVDSEVTSALTAADMTETVAGRRGTAPVPGGVHRRRIRSPFSSSRLSSDAKKPTSRSSLAEQRIIESVVFRPSTTSSSGRSVVDQCQTAAETDDIRRRSVDVIASSDVTVDRQRPAVIKRSLSQGQGQSQDQTTSSSTLVRSISTNNALLPFINGNFNELPYNSESYLYNRAAPCRRGFGGNYRRRSPRPEACSKSTRCPPTSPDFDASLTATEDDDSDSDRHLGTQSMPGTLDRRCRRNRPAPFDGALLMKVADHLSRSHQQEETNALEPSAADTPSVSRSTDDMEPGQISAGNSSSSVINSSPSEVDDISRCQEERTPQDSKDVQVAECVDAQGGGDLLKITSESADDDERKMTRARRSRSDGDESCRRRRRRPMKDVVSEDSAVGRRRCRSLELLQSSTDIKNLRCDAVTPDRTGELGSGGTIRKSDSFDSGIDTKSESTSPKMSGPDSDVVDGHTNSQPDVASPPSTCPDVTPEVLSLTSPEVEYDRKAVMLTGCLGDDDAELRQLLTSSWSRRTPTCYVCDVFDNVVRPLSSHVVVRDADECSDHQVIDDTSAAVDELKTSLLSCVRTKLQALHKEKQRLSIQLLQLQQAISTTSETVNVKVSGDKLCEMYHLYVNERGKLMRLLLMLASRLARADNALANIDDDDSSNNHQVALTTKRDKLRERFDDALELKAGIDRRRARLDLALRDVLSAGELAEFRRSMDLECRLHLDDQWIDDRIEISQRQLRALMDSILSSSQATEC